MTLCPGKNQPQSMTGGWQRDLDSDLKAIQQWGARALVSLMEADEFSVVGVSPTELASQLSHLGVEWIHAPIVDGSVPDDEFMIQWRPVVFHLRGILGEGKSLVFHCLGGLGRSGMMAACMLIELGVTPKDATAAVRAARPGAIENSLQEDFVINYEPLTRQAGTRSGPPLKV